MAKLEPIEKRKLEKLFGMGSGYVLNFVDRTFADFFADYFNIDIEQDKFKNKNNSGSKANRLRAFWHFESDKIVGTSILKMIELWETNYSTSKISLWDNEITEEDKQLAEQCKAIANRLINNSDSTILTRTQIEESIFLEKEFQTIDVKTLNIPQTFTDTIEQRIKETQICLKNKAPLAAIFLIGSTLEGLLIDLANKNISTFNRAHASPKDREGKVLIIKQWGLSSLINVANELGFIGDDVKKYSHSLKDFRNYIHPSEQIKSGFNPDEHTAAISWQVLKAAINDLSIEKVTS